MKQLVKSLCPPRNEKPTDMEIANLQRLFVALETRVSAADADTEARQEALSALGVLLGLTSGKRDLLPPATRSAGLLVLEARLKNELTLV